ncbi:MAG: oxidoreductase [Nocardioides sp.]|uniref:oxidoreductase n=1 Tax=Nocardioides sp. TaxID=35761 RepID=UPI003F0B4A67
MSQPSPRPVAPGTWRPEDMGDQSHVTALVTGPTLGGLGFHTALELARHGARVMLAGRNRAKVAAAATEIRIKVSDARVDEVLLDLASFESVRVGAEDVLGRTPHLDMLVNNAGIMAPPHARTVDGIEQQMATNHFGPFLLTGLLLPALRASFDARVVTVSSQLHRLARRAPLEDPRRPEHAYQRWQSYGQSKLANLLFTYELERRLRAAELPVKALAAHPGMAGTHLAVNTQVPASSRRRASILDGTIRAVSQSAARGAWPTLLAATGDLPGGTYVGPRGLGELSGEPTVVTPTRLARDEMAQRRLWEISEETVGLRWP